MYLRCPQFGQISQGRPWLPESVSQLQSHLPESGHPPNGLAAVQVFPGASFFSHIAGTAPPLP